jgi:aspartyl-tRNA(Asn)/glutamyl-tRNA(Gln) amidotransferase subunit A
MSEIPLTVQDAAQQLRSGEITSVALTEVVIDRAARLDPELGSYLVRFDDTARQAAVVADRELADGRDRGPLHGIPVGVKDILAAVEGPTTAQSLVLDPAWGAGKDAPIVRRLREAGAVITGKTTTMEFAIGMPDASKPFPIPRNPWDLATWPGGSSSGTGSGVAAGFFLAGIGTDTGGSIRIPAAFCGVSGLMPTFSRVPKSGCTPLGYSLDHIGPLARSAWDCGAMLGVLAGHDPSDPDSSTRPVPDYLDGLGSMAGVRVGVVRESHLENATIDTVAAYERAVAVLKDLGAVVTEVVLPLYTEVNAAAMVTMGAEACAYHHNDLATRWDDYFARTRSMVAWGALVSGADFVQAQRVRRAGQRLLQQLFNEVDVLVTPTATTGGPTYDFIDNEDIFAFMGMIHTSYWDAMGNPALVVPMGFTESGMPLSMQLAGRPFDEATLLRVGDAYQSVTAWHRSVPAYAADPVAA